MFLFLARKRIILQLLGIVFLYKYILMYTMFNSFPEILIYYN